MSQDIIRRDETKKHYKTKSYYMDLIKNYHKLYNNKKKYKNKKTLQISMEIYGKFNKKNHTNFKKI